MSSINEKTILVVGCGGLGGYVLQEFARIGVKKLIFLDGDVFEESNLNRQLLSSYSKLGKSKAEVYDAFIRDISKCETEWYSSFLTDDNADLIDKADIVIDCVDTVKTRLWLAQKCEEKNKVLIHGAVEGEMGEAVICYPGKHTLQNMFKNTKENKHKTISFNVAIISSIEVMLAYRVLTETDDEYKNKLIITDLESGLVNKLDI